MAEDEIGGPHASQAQVRAKRDVSHAKGESPQARANNDSVGDSLTVRNAMRCIKRNGSKNAPRTRNLLV